MSRAIPRAGTIRKKIELADQQHPTREMRYLQALQKAKLERETAPNDSRANGSVESPGNGNVGSLPGVLSAENIGIGGPTSHLRSQGVEPATVAPATVVSRVEQLPTSIGTPVSALSGVPEMSVDILSVDPHAVSVTQPQSIYCEEYRNLRTHLLRQSKMDMLQAIVIACVGMGEGKSITALNLSWLLAQTEGITALLIDWDLRRPSLSGYLGLNLKSGLSNVIDGSIGLTEGIVKLNPAGLYLLPGGRARSDVAELISGGLFAQILNEARGIFDYVIIDAPPLGIFTDAAVLINQADAALLVVAANQTSFKDVDRVLESVPRERMLGVVLNKSDESLVHSGYYDYPHYASTGQ